MPPKPVILSTRSFATQGEAERFYREMLRGYAVGERVTEEHSSDLLALLDRHPEYVQKVGCGLSHFAVMMTEQGTPCFRLVRPDGSGTDFSFYWAIKGRPPGRKQEVLSAFRRTVSGDIAKMRSQLILERKVGGDLIECAASGMHIPISEAHVDHRPPLTFELLVVKFIAGRGLEFDQVPITVGTNEQTAPDITDAKLVEAFRAYHAAEAQLALVEKTINLAQSSRHRLSRLQTP